MTSTDKTLEITRNSWQNPSPDCNKSTLTSDHIPITTESRFSQTLSTATMFYPVQDIKLEPLDEVPFNDMPTNEPESILPDLDKTSDKSYSIETVPPYQLVIPKPEDEIPPYTIPDPCLTSSKRHLTLPRCHLTLPRPRLTTKRTTSTMPMQRFIDPTLAGQTNDCLIWRGENPVIEKTSKPQTKTVATQCLIDPTLAGKNNNCLVWRQNNCKTPLARKINTQTKATQCFILPTLIGKTDDCLLWRHDNRMIKKNRINATVATQVCMQSANKTTTGIQCKIKPRSVDTGVQCSTKMCSVKTSTDFHGNKMCRNVATQVNLQRNIVPAVLQVSSAIGNIVNPLYIHVPASLNHVFGIVQSFPSLYSAVWPNRLEIVRKDLMDVPCTGETPCKIIVNSDGIARRVTVFRTIQSIFDVSNADQLRDELVRLSDKGRHVFCPGVESWCSDVSNGLVVNVKWPSERLQSKKCLEWYPACINLLKSIVMSGIARCSQCIRLQRYLRNRKPTSVLEEKKRKRKVSISNKQKEKNESERAKGVVLDDEEYEELVKIVSAMAQESTLQEVLLLDESVKGQSDSKADWVKNRLGHLSKLKCLVTDQKLNKAQEGKGNRWSSTTMKLAMEIYKRSPATYHRLRDFKLLKLPCVRHMKRMKSRANAQCGYDKEKLLQESNGEITNRAEESLMCTEENEKVELESDSEMSDQTEETFIIPDKSPDISNSDAESVLGENDHNE